jgi:uncharacterized protein
MTPPIDRKQMQQAIERDFQCMQCGHCCKGTGLVHVGAEEIARIARYLNLSEIEFLKEHAQEDGPGHWVLRDKWVDSASSGKAELWCKFLETDPQGLYICAVNPAKPDQCASFPARWRNHDSLRTCAGLRALTARLRLARENAE